MLWPYLKLKMYLKENGTGYYIKILAWYTLGIYSLKYVLTVTYKLLKYIQWIYGHHEKESDELFYWNSFSGYRLESEYCFCSFKLNAFIQEH